MPRTTYGAGVYGGGDADQSPTANVGFERIPALAAFTPAASSRTYVADSTPITALAALTRATQSASVTTPSEPVTATGRLTPAAVVEIWYDDAAGSVALTAAGAGNDRWIVEDHSGTGPAPLVAPGGTTDRWAVIDPSGTGPTSETEPGAAIGQERAPIVSTVAPATSQSERDRIEGYLKTPFKTPVGERTSGGDESDFGALVAMAAQAAEDHAIVRDQMVYSRYVDTAIGNALESIGAGVLVDRVREEDGSLETDEHYRIRIKAQRRALTGSGLLIQIRRGIASLLGVRPGSIIIYENFAEEKAAFTIELTERMLNETDTPLEYIIEFVDLIRAGGVNAQLTLRGEFRYRDKNAENDPEHGYNNAPYTGDLRTLL